MKTCRTNQICRSQIALRNKSMFVFHYTSIVINVKKLGYSLKQSATCVGLVKQTFQDNPKLSYVLNAEVAKSIIFVLELDR